MKEIRHCTIKEQAKKINEILRGHYNYYGIGGNFGSLQTLYRTTERYWFRMLRQSELERENKLGKISQDKEIISCIASKITHSI